jgi:hypothetical protein
MSMDSGSRTTIRRKRVDRRCLKDMVGMDRRVMLLAEREVNIRACRDDERWAPYLADIPTGPSAIASSFLGYL